MNASAHKYVPSTYHLQVVKGLQQAPAGIWAEQSPPMQEIVASMRDGGYKLKDYLNTPELFPKFQPFDKYLTADVGYIFCDNNGLVYSEDSKVLHSYIHPHYVADTLGECPTNLTLRQEVEIVSGYALFCYPGLESITFTGEGDVVIEDYAFRSESSLIAIHNLNRVTHIGVGAFSGCEKLGVFHFPSTLKEIETRAFENTGLVCADLRDYGGSLIHAQTFKGAKDLEVVFLSNKIKGIHPSAFKDCESLKTIFIENEYTKYFLPEYLRPLCQVLDITL